MFQHVPVAGHRTYFGVLPDLPLPKLTPKSVRRTISEDFQTLVRKGQEHILDEPAPVAFMSLSQMLDSFDMKLSTAATLYYFKSKNYPLVVTPEVAFDLAHVIKQTEKEDRGFGALFKSVWASNDLVPEELELGLLANAELETIVFGAWSEVLRTVSNTQYSHSGRILRVDVRVVASAMARAGKGLETCVMTTAPEIVSLVAQLGQRHPIRILGSDVPIRDFYTPAFEKIAVLLTEEFVAALPDADEDSYAFFKEVEVIEGSRIKKLVGFKIAPEPNDSAGKDYIIAPIFPEEQASESLPLLGSYPFLVFKPAGDMPASIVGTSVMKIKDRGVLVDNSGYYQNVPFGSYLKDSQISKSWNVRESAREHLTKRGMVIPHPLSYAIIDDAIIASNL